MSQTIGCRGDERSFHCRSKPISDLQFVRLCCLVIGSLVCILIVDALWGLRFVVNLSDSVFGYQIHSNRHNEDYVICQVDGGLRYVGVNEGRDVVVIDRELDVGFRREGEGGFDEGKVEKLLNFVVGSLLSDKFAGLDDH